jgi:hypothetical protein
MFGLEASVGGVLHADGVRCLVGCVAQDTETALAYDNGHVFNIETWEIDLDAIG